MVGINDISALRPPQLYTDLQAVCTEFKNRFATLVLGSIDDCVVDCVPIYDPALLQSPRGENSAQLVHRDSVDPSVVNFIIPLTEDYLVRFFDADEKTALLIAPSSRVYCRFGSECHQGV